MLIAWLMFRPVWCDSTFRHVHEFEPSDAQRLYARAYLRAMAMDDPIVAALFADGVRRRLRDGEVDDL